MRAWLFVVLLAPLLGNCSSRPVATATSPDKARRAEVRDVWCFDGPCQSIWVGRAESLRKVADLGEDFDWCTTIVWSRDSSTAAFLVRDVRLVTVDVATARVVGNTCLIDVRGDARSGEFARDLALTADGKTAMFSLCQRTHGVGVACRNEARLTRTIDV